MNFITASHLRTPHFLPRVAFRHSFAFRSGLGIAGFTACLLISAPALAATAPALGTASTYGIAASTFTNIANASPLTRIAGDVCTTTPSAMPASTITGAYTDNVSAGGSSCNGAHPTMGADITAALSTLNGAGQGCINVNGLVGGGTGRLDTVVVPGGTPAGTFPPGCYSVTGAMHIDAGTVTLKGAGVYIFKSTGTLDTITGTSVAKTAGACEADVFWAPAGATTLATNSSFKGSIVDGIANAITLGANTTVVGRLLSHGGTVTTDKNDITVPSCVTVYPPVLVGNVDLDAAAPVSIKYATEQPVLTAGTNLAAGAAADQTATTTFGASFATDAVAYVRVDLTGGTFTAAPAFAVNDSIGAATVSIAQGGAAGDNYVIFAVDPLATENLVGANVTKITTNGITVTSQGSVGMQYRLYETLTNAANVTNHLKTASANYITFSPALTIASVAFDGAATSAVADVSATNGAYTAFTGPATVKPLSKISATLNTVALQSGAPATVALVLADTNSVAVNGDFSYVANANGTYTGLALEKVNLDTSSTCATGAGGIYDAATLSATDATFTAVTAADLVTGMYLCVEPNGTSEITASSYSGTATLVAQTGFSVANLGMTIGSITRNGTVMVAPLAQIPAGWISRLVLNNIGSTDRTYTVRAVNEAGTTITLSGAAASGTLTGNSTTVVDLSTTMAGGARGTLVVTVNGPSDQIEGMYQIVNGTANTISNHVLAHK